MARQPAGTNPKIATRFAIRTAATALVTALTWGFAAATASTAWAASTDSTSPLVHCGTAPLEQATAPLDQATAPLEQATATLEQANLAIVRASLTPAEEGLSAPLATGMRIYDDTRNQSPSVRPCDEPTVCSDDRTRIEDADMATEGAGEPQRVLQLLGRADDAQLSQHPAEIAGESGRGTSGDLDAQANAQRDAQADTDRNDLPARHRLGDNRLGDNQPADNQRPDTQLRNLDRTRDTNGCDQPADPTRPMTLPAPTPAGPNQPASSDPVPPVEVEEASAEPTSDPVIVKAANKAANKKAKKAPKNAAKTAPKNAAKNAAKRAADPHAADALAYTGISTFQLFLMSLLLLGIGIPLATVARKQA